MVKEFMQTFGQECPSEFVFLSNKKREFRHELTYEENQELRDAKDKVAYLDAVCDKLYVTFGDAVAAGIDAHTLLAAFAEVHRSNMSKLWKRSEVDAITHSQHDIQAICNFNKREIVGYLVKRKDGKVLKSPSYSPAQLEQFCS